MRRTRWMKAAGVLAVSVGLAATALPGTAGASSHREAPLISRDQVADNTDVYVFKDATDPTKLNVIANYIPFEIPQGGPNFYGFGDDVKYSIHIDNNGDVDDDITYNFRFRTTYNNPDTFLYNTGVLTTPNDADRNVRQSYSVERVDAGGSRMLATDVPTPPTNVGVRSTPTYESALAAPTVTSLAGGGSVFAGPRQDPFFVDTGSVFDLLGLRPLNSNHLITPPTDSVGVDGLGGANVHTIALQLPITAISQAGNVPTTVDSAASVVGVYASSSRQRVKVLSVAGGAPRTSGRWVQVSRLGIPLVNEVLIPIGKKDLWNASDPKDDAQFFANILNPEPAILADALYPALQTPPQGGFDGSGTPRRTDIVAVLSGAATGVMAGFPPADLLRVNLATPVSSSGSFTRLGFLGAAGDGSNGNADGFPNGRRLGDDVTDTLLRLLVGGTALTPTPASNAFPNNALTDGVDEDDRANLGVFPYVGTPFNGYNQEVPGSSAP